MTSLHGASIKIDYNASKVKWGGFHQVGDLLTGGFDDSGLAGGVEGSVVLGVTGTGEVDGEGVIVTVPFVVIASGNSFITINGTESKLTDSKSPPIEHTVSSWEGGTIIGL